MDEQSQKQLDEILVKDLHELTENDKAVLRARVHYLGKNSRKKFAEVLAETPQAPQEDTKEEEPEGEKKEAGNPFPPINEDEDEDDSVTGDTTTDTTDDEEDDE